MRSGPVRADAHAFKLDNVADVQACCAQSTGSPPGKGHGAQHQAGSSGSVPTGFPARDSLIFSTLSSADDKSRSQWFFSFSPRS